MTISVEKAVQGGLQHVWKMSEKRWEYPFHVRL